MLPQSMVLLRKFGLAHCENLKKDSRTSSCHKQLDMIIPIFKQSMGNIKFFNKLIIKSYLVIAGLFFICSSIGGQNTWNRSIDFNNEGNHSTSIYMNNQMATL